MWSRRAPRASLDRGPLNRALRAVATGAVAAAMIVPISAGLAAASATDHQRGGGTESPIKHVVVIFQENHSFDHHFGTYPNATNTDGTPSSPAKHTRTSTGSRPRCSRRTRTGRTAGASIPRPPTTCSPVTRTTTTPTSRRPSTTGRWTSSSPRSATARGRVPRASRAPRRRSWTTTTATR